MSTILSSGWWLIILVGLAAGGLSSSLGVGSGIIVVPALFLLLHCTQKSAQGMALALMVPMALLGAIQYSRMPGVHLRWDVVALLVLGALLGVLAGTHALARIPDSWLQRAFAVFLIIVAIRMLWPAKPACAASGPVRPVVGNVDRMKDSTHE